MAERLRRLHPLRLQYELFSDTNPLMASVKTMAERRARIAQPVSADNPFLAAQEALRSKSSPVSMRGGT